MELEYLNRELATKSQLKSELLASTTHELRTPVSAITGLIELLKAEELNKQSMDYVRQIGLCCNALNNSINDVLDLSKIEAGEFRVQSSVFSPQVLLSEVVDALKMLAQNKSLVLKHETQGLPSYLKGDARRIQQLLINYGSNALKFTQAGFVCFRAYQVGDTEQVRFEVEDTGCGIPQEEAARVFERHYQAANQDFEGAELGTGLGLSIVKEIVAQLGGICGCRSQVGVGSVFWFELRLPSVNEASTEAVEVLSGETRGQSKTVLLAEDNAILAQIFQNQIKKLGHQVVTTNNGVEALEAFDPDTIDLVVFDARMPRMGGFEASAALRTKFPEWQGPVYILTADATIPVQEQGEHGVTKVFVKPMNMDDLKRLIKSS